MPGYSPSAGGVFDQPFPDDDLVQAVNDCARVLYGTHDLVVVQSYALDRHICSDGLEVDLTDGDGAFLGPRSAFAEALLPAFPPKAPFVA